ncbi:MAG: hypothetical protein M1828_007629 [Chrysothrix sp. TS-e1954]|nr:MAG: hypothetical protein M1828_007629 [Chrysothrix sp. TS-e1954]
MEFSSDQFSAGILLNGRYESVSPLNHGSFGMVFMARDRQTDGHVAIKCLKKPSAGLEQNSSIKIDDRSEELALHGRIVNHPNIVNLLESFETTTHIYLVLEFCSMGDLYEAIRQDKGPKETEHVRAFMIQLVNAVEALHEKGIFHRDIKPENVFLSESGKMKLGDFGLATTEVWSHEIAVGSDRYMAPEQFDPQGEGLSPAKADIWSIGICLLNILFSRNPFGEPALSDPLFKDFSRDRQSLFDVFPNMSQDTFNVLNHSLTINPDKRSLAMMRDALQSVVSFTTDDESLDEFCTENRDTKTATAHREPLRTPSVASPAMSQGGAFPWSNALHMTTPKSTRQLSAIHDNESYSEDLFPASEASTHDWFSKADTQSFDSMLDSGLGVSIGSSNHATLPSPTFTRSRPVAISGSLPTFGRAGQALSNIFGKKKQFESKSWSDMFEEEEEEREEMEREREQKTSSKIQTVGQLDSESEGRVTPRAVLKDITQPSQSRPIPATDDGISQNTGFVYEDGSTPTARYSPPAKRLFKDKWSRLGELRRGSGTPDKESSTLDSKLRRFSATTRRRNIGLTFGRQGAVQKQNDHEVCQKKEWNTSTDWRRDQAPKPSPLRPLHASQLDGGFDSNRNSSSSDEAVIIDYDDDSGPEWVGGWKDLHL